MDYRDLWETSMENDGKVSIGYRQAFDEAAQNENV